MSRSGPVDLWAAVRDGFRTQLWPLPSAAVVVAIALGVGLPRLEAAQVGLVPRGLRDFLFTGGPDAARTVLDAVAGSLITVTALTFSLTVVTLQLASSQFSPRLLRTFTRDLVVQATLGLFLGTFAYALTVLRTVRARSQTHAEFVPDVSVTLAYLLAVASVLGLIFFLAHLAQTIRVESMLHNVHEDASANLERELTTTQEVPRTLESLTPRRPSTVLTAGSSGFLVRIQENDLLQAAVEADAIVVVDVCPGSWLVAGTPVGAFWSDSTSPAPRGSLDHIAETVRATLVTSFERTSLQDVSFGLRQLTDVAIKALSPGINDPTTAVHALGHSSALLCQFARRDLGPRVLRDEQGETRVVLARPDLRALLRLTIDQPARYGAADPAVLTRLFTILRELAWVSAPHQHPVVVDEVARLRRLVARQHFGVEDAAELGACANAVEAALQGRWDEPSRHQDEHHATGAG